MKTPIRRSAGVVGKWAAGRSLVRRLHRAYGLRCVLYHEIAESPSPFTAGLGVTTTPSMLADHLEFLAADYRFVNLEWVLGGGQEWPYHRPPLLVTFDDAYASVAHVAADICSRAGAPSVFFVNGAFIDNRILAFDNLVAWVVNTYGMSPIVAATRRDFGGLKEFFVSHLASLSIGDRARLYDELARLTPVGPATMAADASLYVSGEDLSAVGTKGMAVGNHTWSHVHTRSLDPVSTAKELAGNQRFLEAIVGRRVEAFSYPYGSRIDATDAITAVLTRLGHRAGFLVEAQVNRANADVMRLSRVSVGSIDAPELFADLEILPLLRSVRNRARRRRTRGFVGRVGSSGEGKAGNG